MTIEYIEDMIEKYETLIKAKLENRGDVESYSLGGRSVTSIPESELRNNLNYWIDKKRFFTKRIIKHEIQ